MPMKKDTRAQIRKILDAAGLMPKALLERPLDLQWMADDNGNLRAENVFGKYEVLHREDGIEAWTNKTELGLFVTEHNAKLACALHYESCMCLLLRRGIGAETYVLD